MKHQKQIIKKQEQNRQNTAPQKNIVEKIKRFFDHKIVTTILLIIISLVFYSNYSAIFDKKVNLNGDNIVYFSCGKAIAEGKGYTNTMSFEETPHTHFPPGYSLFIAGLQKISPNDIIFVKKVNGVLLWLSLLLLFWLIKRITNNTPVAFCTALFTTIQTQILSFATIMMSEMLFIFISLTAIHLAIYLNEKIFLKKGAWKKIALLVLFLLNIVYIYFVRSMGISLIIALVLWFGMLALQSLFLFLKEKKEKAETSATSKKWLIQRIAICLLIGVSFLVSHTSWNARQVSAGKTESDYKSDFLRKPKGETMKTWDDWKTRIEYNISGNITKWIPSALFSSDYDNNAKITTAQWIKGILILIVLVLGLFFLKQKTFWLLFFYLSIHMGVSILYPEQYASTRYLTPIIPFLVFLFFNGIANFVALVCRFSKKINPFVVQIIVLFISACFIYPNCINAQTELRKTAKTKTWEKTNNPKMANYLEACKFFKNDFPDTIRVITRKPEIFYMYSGYKKARSFPWYAEPDTVISYLKKQKATHLILDDWFRHAYVTLYPAVQKYPEKFKVLKIIGVADVATSQNPTYVLEFNDEWGYYGERIDGKKTGEGYEILQDGRKYVGHFEENTFNGYGTLYDKDGNVILKGKWRNGAPINVE